jgi:4-hydroxy-tetrahydrodipicolinate synthase
MNKFTGAGVALITPFKLDYSIDYIALEKLVEHQIKNGTNYLVVQGTTGESATLSNKEKIAVLDFVIEINAGRLPVVLGVGGNNTLAVGKQLQFWEKSKIDGFLSVSPYYNKPSQNGIISHYNHLSSCTDLPIILYNVPGRTSSNMSPETTLELAHNCENIVAIKEASGSLEQIMTIIQNKPSDFLVISGDDALTLPHIAIGGHGAISVVANAFPKRFSTMVNAALDGDLTLANQKHYELFPVIQHLFADGNPGGIKHALKLLNIGEDVVRLPLVKVNEKTADNIYAQVAKLGEAII